MSNHRPNFVRSADSRKIEDLLSSAKIGDVVSYQQIDDAIGRDCRSFCRGAIQHVRRRLLRERGMVFGVVMDVGLKRLNPSETVSSVSKDADSIRRSARRANEKLSTVDRQALSQPERTSLDINQARFAVLEMCASSKGEKAIQHQVDQSKTTLAMAQALEALKKA